VNWVDVGRGLGAVWYRGNRQTFVAVRPDGSVVGARYRSRASAILALVWDARSREQHLLSALSLFVIRQGSARELRRTASN
jgi:hypothetical protein